MNNNSTKESKVKNENYIVIQGFMVNELKLKGNELMVYAIIYGFSQEENQRFTGSLQYLADWTNSTKQGVLKNLKSLQEKNYIGKEDKIINGVKFCEYYTTKLNEVLNKVEGGIKQSLTPIKQSLTPIKQSLTGGIKQSLPNNIELNNIENNIEYIKEENKEEKRKPELQVINNQVTFTDTRTDTDKIKTIINYLNTRAETNYKYTSNKTQSLIKARFKEGFTVKDFLIVIDKKCIDWLHDSKMNTYLRPETLFGTKFEGYLNQPVKTITTKDIAVGMDFSDIRNIDQYEEDNLF